MIYCVDLCVLFFFFFRNIHIPNRLLDNILQPTLGMHCLFRFYSKYLCCDRSKHVQVLHFWSISMPHLDRWAQSKVYNLTMKSDKMFLLDEMLDRHTVHASNSYEFLCYKFSHKLLSTSAVHSQ